MNRGLVSAAIGIGLAQFLKIPIAYVKTGRWQWARGFRSGGMPSSHSAGVSALASYIALKRGWKSIDFALSAVFALIVMYDAMGIRRHAGEIAVRVNKLSHDFQNHLSAEFDDQAGHTSDHPGLREMIGHFPEEVAAGMLLGGSVGAWAYLLEQKRR